MAVPVSELQKSNRSKIIELFQLELVTAIHGVDTTYYFHNGVSANNNASLIFNNIQYTRMPIEASGFDYDSKTLPRPTLSISNILGTFTTLLLTLSQGLEGAKVTRIRTLERYIDNTNFDGGDLLIEGSTTDFIVQEDDALIDQEEGTNPYGTPSGSTEFPREIYFIDRKKDDDSAKYS